MSPSGFRVRWSWLGVGLVGLLAVGMWVRLRAEPASTPDQEKSSSGAEYRIEVELAEVTRADVASTLELTGNLLPRRRTMIMTEVDGVIQSIPRSKEIFEVEIDGRQYREEMGLDIGQPVAAGEILVQIDPRDFELDLKAAKARLAKAERDLDELRSWRRPEELRRLEADRDEAAAQLELARTERERLLRLKAQNVATQSEFDRANADFKSNQAALERAEAELELARGGPTEQEIAVAQALVAQAQADVEIKASTLEKTTIRAPYDGVITDRFLDEGERVTAQPRVEIMEIMDLSIVSVQVGVPERYLHRIRKGDWTTVQAEGSIEPVPGIVILVNDKIDHETRTFRVRVAIENLERRFKPGQFARVGFNVATSQQALAVPSPALTYEGGQAQVFVFDAGRVSLRPVRIGLAGGGLTEVLSGLEAGLSIVVDDPSILADGMLVRPKPNKPLAQTKGAITR